MIFKLKIFHSLFILILIFCEIKAENEEIINNALPINIEIIKNIIPQFEAVSINNGKSLMNNQSRIIGGQNILTYEQANYIVGLYIDSEKWCSGVVITKLRVLTVAHCLYEKNSVVAYFGYISLSSPPPEAMSMEVHHEDFIIHPDFDSISLKNDIAVIKLPVELSFESYKIKPISIYNNPNTALSGTVLFTGWGITSDSSTELSDYLQYVHLNLTTYQSCYNAYPAQIFTTNICTKSNTNSFKGGCLGDSGGPLVANIGGYQKLIGLLSFTSTGGCNTMDPRGYTKVASYTTFLCDMCQICSV